MKVSRMPAMQLAALVLLSCSMLFSQPKAPIDYINPYIGSISPKTGGTSPLVYVPHGMLACAPRFTPGIGDQYLADRIFGFPVAGIAVMATTGPIKAGAAENASRFDHDLETATPYYYSVLLEDPNIQAEYTLADHAIYFRFTFPRTINANVLLSGSRDASVELKGSTVVEGATRGGMRRNGGQGGDALYFHAEVKKPCAASGTFAGDVVMPGSDRQSGERSGAFLSYATDAGEQIEVKIGFSAVSPGEAGAVLNKEIPGWEFERAKDRARSLWNNALGRIAVEGGTEEQKTIFYTALYRTMGRKGNVWDTYRCAYPLQTIIEPEENMKAVRTFVDAYEKTGWLPSSGAMIGNHSTAVITDSYMKGLRDFNAEKAYEGMKKNAMEATMIPWRDRGSITELERCYFEKGYYPALPVREDAKVADMDKWRADVEDYIGSNMPYQITWLPEVGVKEWVKEVDSWHRRQSVSVTLEHCYDDWCLAQMAKALGKNDDYAYFMKRAHNYQNLYDSTIGFMAPKTADGQWVRPFDPKLSGGFAGEGFFAECNSWIYTWHVQHDVQGLINLMGGRAKFLSKLNALFVEQYGMDKPAFVGQFPDMSGLIGMYCQGNEPAFHIPYLYNYAGAPWLTQRHVREIMKIWYNAGPTGLSGDDDGGAMSAWYVFSAMGFYPQCPGQPVYDIGSPIFRKVMLDVGGGKTFMIEANSVSEKNKYIQSAALNGQPYSKPWLSHADIVKGGRLVFEMGPRPNEKWGSAPGDAPPSMSAAQD